MPEPTKTTTGRASEADRLWAITAYYNPVGYRRRRENYRRFRDGLRIPLVAVELAFGNDFQLGDGDAEILIRLRGGDVMWQKERLLNIALASVPAACSHVAWIDCDVVFARDDWADAAMTTLESRPMVQLFARVHYLPPDHPLDQLRPDAAYMSRPSIASLGVSERFLGFEGRGPGGLGPAATGMAWAARRELIEAHGFYDACIAGGGDAAMFAAAHLAPEQCVRRQRMNERHAAHYHAWATEFGRAVAGGTAAVEGDVFHLWHGDFANRGRPVRHEMLAAAGFDPDADVALDCDGAWRWASEKPALHDYLKQYFVARREDG